MNQGKLAQKGSTIRLIHWNATEACERASRLESLGYVVESKMLDPVAMKGLKQNPPAAVVIDLTRLPAQGRDFGVWLRKQKSTRQVALIFVEGEPAKIKRVKAVLPDATYTSWRQIAAALKQALTQKPSEPIVPTSVFEAYKNKPLAEKLGIKPRATVVLVDAPKGFEQVLGKLPSGVRVLRGLGKQSDLAICFVKTQAGLEKEIPKLVPLAGGDGLWIAWPKKSSGVASDLTQTSVRKIAESAGLVDYKISSIDQTWSGLRFTFKKSKS